MSVDFWGAFFEKLKSIYEKEDGNLNDYELELPILDDVLKKINEELKGTYDFIEPIDRGGAGVVIRLKDKRLDLDRVLKIPRPKKDTVIDSVRNEIEYLKKIRHENIISIYNSGEIKLPSYPSYPYFVMEYIEGAGDLRKKTKDILKNSERSKELKEITRGIANKFYSIAKALDFLHKHQIIHFDVKPGNMLIDKDGKSILSDLGFAKKKSDDNVPVMVGFTFFYAHPNLSAGYYHMSSKNRVGKEMPPVIVAQSMG